MALNLNDWLAYTKAADVASIADERFNELRTAWDSYYGRNPKPLSIEQRPNQPEVDDNVALNCAATIVDEAVSALTGDGLEIEISPKGEPLDSQGEDDGQTQVGSAAQSTVEELWWEPIAEANRFDMLLHNTATCGAVCGHMFWKINPNSGVTGSLPRIINLNPATVSVSTNEEDMAEVWAYAIRFEVKTGGKCKQRLEVIAKGQPGTIVQSVTGTVEVVPDPNAATANYWTVTDYDYNEQNRAWLITSNIVWPYEFAPIVDVENLPDPSQYYGKADLSAAIIAMDKAVDRSASIINRVCRVVGFPRPVATGISPQQATRLRDAKIGDAFFLENKDAKMQMLEMQGDLSALADWHKSLRGALMNAGANPDLNTDKLDMVGKLSGLAMQILYSKQERRVRLKRLNLETLITETIRRLRIIANQDPDIDIEYRWPSVLPANTKEDMEVATLKRDIGVSQDTLIAELGYDPANEAMKREAEGAKQAELSAVAFGAGTMFLPGDNVPQGRLPANQPVAPTGTNGSA